MVSSKFDLSCLAPTDNSLTKTFLLLLHFLVFCAFIITPHFHLCKRFLTFVFSKFKHTFYIHQKKGTHYICTPSNFNNFSFFSIPPAYPVKLLWIQLLYGKESKLISYYVLQHFPLLVLTSLVKSFLRYLYMS